MVNSYSPDEPASALFELKTRLQGSILTYGTVTQFALFVGRIHLL